ncbi:WD40 repeat domain-containing protein [Prosthecobacter dejongeii]|uniref:WD40 repeat protein n=1 Tax=Prosthecobacter dejongeii TaxID=48465 RepID=A0A7W7YI83_9BACT|nr:WD40 repeat domain-containing protein [Prosthecobacter dejongeii]MBB5036658.1 WD40 repeat protein [Prosthecobacter dejongeii]
MQSFYHAFLLTALLWPLSSLAQSPEVPPADWKLEFLPRTAPTLLGHLGEPEIGSLLPEREPRMVWHPSGRLFVSNSEMYIPEEEVVIQVWSTPTPTLPAKCKGALNAGGGWALSTAGNRLCAQAYKPTEKSPYLDSDEYLAVSCFRFPEGVRIWKHALKKEEELVATCFSTDDKKVLAATQQGTLCTLRVLDAETGVEESRLVVPGSQNRFPSPECLAAIGDEFVMLLKPQTEDAQMFQVKLNPLRLDPGPFKGVLLDNMRRLVVSKDERYLAIFGGENYEVLQATKGGWESCLDGRVRDLWADHGSFLTTSIFSPDSRWLFVSTSEEAKVIDLAAQKVVKELPGGEGAAWSPDGTKILVMEHSGIGVFDTSDWSYRPSVESQHDCPVLQVKFIPDGKTLVSRDHNGLIVWDVETRKPRALLQGSRKTCHFDSFVLANGGQDIIAGDGWDYLRWTLPSADIPPPGRPEKKMGTLAFGGVLNPEEQHSHQGLFADVTGQRIITATTEGILLRDLSRLGTVKTLSSLRAKRFSADDHLVFLDSENVCAHHSNGEVSHLDLKSDELTKLAEHKGANYSGLWLPGRECYVSMSGSAILFIHAKTGAITQTLRPRRGGAFFSPTFDRGGLGFAVTPDEKMAAVYLVDLSRSQKFVSLWDIDSAQMLALQELPGMDVNCLDFSANGKVLAIGHQNTAISLWDVSKLLSLAPPPELPARTSTGSRQNLQLSVVTEGPMEPLPDADGHQWSFHADGSCSVAERLPSFGSLKVNGKPFVSRAVAYLKKVGNEKVATPFSLDRQGEIEGEGVWVNRHLGLHSLFMTTGTVVHAVDGFTNTTDRTAKVDISFEIQYPGDSQGIMTAAETPLKIPQDGQFSLGANDRWLAPTDSGKVGETLVATRIQALVKKESPRMHWHMVDKKLQVIYSAEIPPGETRWLIHGVTLVKRYAEGTINAITGFPDHADVGHYVPAGNESQGLNFGRPDLWNPEHQKGPLPSTMVWSSADPKPKPESDGLGLTWEMQYDHGRYGELGATSVNQIWFDGHPARMTVGQSLLHAHSKGQLVIPPSIGLYDPLSKISVYRKDQNLEGGIATVWQDRFYHAGQEAQTVRVSYVTTFRSPVIEVWDAKGQKHSVADFKGSALGLGGASAFVLEGEQQPATLLAFHREGAAICPTVRWLGPRAIALDYEFRLEPKVPVTLLHGACQRPLKAFGGALPAFADWLPLKLLPSPSAPSSKTGQIAVQPVSILNYVVDPSP